MTAAQFLEVIVSLPVQVALLVFATHMLARLTNRDAVLSRLWTGCHVLILALTLRAFLLPRLRPLAFWPSRESFPAVEVVLVEQRIGQGLFVLWITGAAYAALRFLLGWFQVQRFLKSCHPFPEAKWDCVFCTDPHEQSPVKERPQLLTSDRLLSPFCWQFHRPLIVLPKFLLDFEPEELRLIVRHELAHLRTGHPLMLFIQRTVQIVFWFHPVVWWSSRQAQVAREFACDEAAVQSRSDVANYLRSLLKIVERVEEEADSGAIDLAFGRGKGVIALRASRLVTLAKQARHTMPAHPSREKLPYMLATIALVIAIFVWPPLDLNKSYGSAWSPWPTWSAETLHALGFPVRDYDTHDYRFRYHELREDQSKMGDPSQSSP
jgi:beta-lactamase regulating signal transducer with metallopeptidase domain